MTASSQPRSSADGGEILRWHGQVVSAEELRRTLNGHRELLLPARAVVTPSAAELLRARGIRIIKETTAPSLQAAGPWGFAQERPYANVSSVLAALEREGVRFAGLPARGSSSVCAWAQAGAKHVSRGECQGAMLIGDDPGLICCVANKLPGLRAVAVTSPVDAARATATLGANLLAVLPAGRTFFEIRQILRTVYQAGNPACPADVARALQELDSHAHR
jgi:ribose 5-phosphate isomerase RpiB